MTRTTDQRRGSGECDVLILGAEELTGLAVARDLRQVGLKVLGGGTDPSGFGFRSNALESRFIYPNPERDLAGFAAAVREAALRYRVRAILPCLDSALMALDKTRDVFEGVAPLGIAPPRALEIISDKLRTQELAISLGVDIPMTVLMDRVGAELPAGFRLPAVVKQGSAGLRGPQKAIYCRTPAEVDSAVNLYLGAGVTAVAQELIYGHGVQLVGICRRGELVQAFQYRRLREYGCRGGGFTLAESEPIHPALRDMASRLTRALNWEGVLGVETKNPEDAPDRFVLMEINGRFVGTIDLARAAGINFPSLQYRLTLGEDLPRKPIPYRTGLRYRRWLYDSLALIELLFERPDLTGVPLPSAPRAVWNYFAAYDPRVGSDTFRLRDPMPSIVNMRKGLPVIARVLARALRDAARPSQDRGAE